MQEKLTIDAINTKIISNLSKKKILYHQKMTLLNSRDLLQTLKVVIDFEDQDIKQDGVNIPMMRIKSSKNNIKELYAIFQLATEHKTVQRATN